MSKLLVFAAALWLLALAAFLLYVSEDGMECQGENCSTVADVTGALLAPLVVLALVASIAAGVRAMVTRAGSTP